MGFIGGRDQTLGCGMRMSGRVGGICTCVASDAVGVDGLCYAGHDRAVASGLLLGTGYFGVG